MTRYGRSYPAAPIIIRAVLPPDPNRNGSGALVERADTVAAVGANNAPRTATGVAVVERRDTSTGVGVFVSPTMFSDDFNRANTTAGVDALGPNWVNTSGAWYISGNHVTKLTENHHIRWASPLPSEDMFIEADVPKANLDQFMWMHIRAANNTVGATAGIPLAIYEAGINVTGPGPVGSEPGKAELGIIHADGSYTVFGRGDIAFSGAGPTVRIRLEAVGNKIRFLTDGFLIIDTVDPLDELHGHYAGLNCYIGSVAGGAWYDNVVIGVVVPPTGSGAVVERRDTVIASPKLFGTGAVTEQRDTASGVALASDFVGAIVGTSTIGTLTDAALYAWESQCYVAGAKVHTAGVGDVVTEVAVYVGAAGPAATASMAIYVISGGVPTTRVGSPITVPIPTVEGWSKVTTSIPLTTGVTYGVAIQWVASGTAGWQIRFEHGPGPIQQSNGGSGAALATTWAATGTDTDMPSYYAGVTIGPRTGSGAIIESHDTTAVPPPPAVLYYPASISGRKLLNQTGGIYLARTFSSWSMASHLTNAQITQALTDAATNHFNGVTVWCGGVEDRGGTGWAGNKYKNAAGQNFWSDPVLPWRSSLGPAWASVDWMVAEAERLGITVHFSFCHGYGGFGCAADWVAASDAEMTAAGVAIAARYAAAPNIVWHVMLDDPIGPTGAAALKIRKLFDGINTTEGASTRPVRWCETDQPSSTSSQGWYDPTGAATSTRFSINCLYSWNTDSASRVENAYGETSGPVGDCEPVYVGNTASYGGSAQQVRERAYSVFLEGGSLINWGHEAWWPFGAAKLFPVGGMTWETVAAAAETIEARYCWDLIDVYCKDATWAPTSTFVTTGEGTGDTKAAQGFSTTAAVAYFPDNRTVAVDTTIIAGTGDVRLRWYDPTAGTFTTIAAAEAQQTGRSVTVPAAHTDGSRDWVLVVDTPGSSGPPGTPGGYIGTTPITAVRIGTTTVTKLYVGTTQAWP